jgi:hypothetical protein
VLLAAVLAVPAVRGFTDPARRPTAEGSSR